MRERTIGSPVQNFGTQNFVNEPIADFVGDADDKSHIEKLMAYAHINPLKLLAGPTQSKSLVDSRDVKMHYLYKRIERNGGEDAHQELVNELQSRMQSDNLFKNVFAHHAEANELIVVPENFQCLRFLMSVHDVHCGRFDDYSLKFVKHLVHACETVEPHAIAAVAELIEQHCASNILF